MKKLSISSTFKSHDSTIAVETAIKTLGRWLVRNEVEVCMSICLLSFIAMIFLMSEFLFSSSL